MLEKSNKKLTNKNFEVKIFLNKIKINAHSINYQKKKKYRYTNWIELTGF
jgi:hypothetical protein